MPLRVVKLEQEKEKNLHYPIDKVLLEIEDFEEIFIVVKKKGGESYKRFSTAIKSTFWWLGAFEAVKSELMGESLVYTEEE